MMQNWLVEKVITTIPRGQAQGLPCVRFTFSDQPATNPEVREVFEFVGQVSLRSRAVLFVGTFPDHNTNAFDAMTKSFAEAGVTVFVITDGASYQSFFTNAGVYTIVVLDGPDWSSFPCKEVHYHFTPGSQREPIVPVKCYLNYLIPSEGTTTRDLMTFISSSQVTWRIGDRRESPWVLKVREGDPS